MFRSRGFRIGLMAVFLTISGAQAQPARQALVLQGGTLIDGTGRAPIANAVVVVQGERITQVGTRGRVAIPAGAKVINLAGRTILPGLIEGHVHSVDWQAPMFLHYGITTITDFDSDTAWVLAQREMYNNGRIKGPRMFVAGGKLWGPLQPGPVQRADIARTPEEAREYLRSVEALNVDFLKVDDTLTYEQLAVAVDEGKRTGLKVLAHVQNIRKAGEMGIKFAEHLWPVWNALLDPDGTKYAPYRGRFYYPKGSVGLPARTSESQLDPKTFPSLIDFMVKEGIYFNPTLLNHFGATTPLGIERGTESTKLVNDPQMAWASPEAKASFATQSTDGPRLPEEYALAARFLREFSQAGGKVIVGSEGTPGLSMHYEMFMMVEAGISNMKALQGATLWNAEKIGKEKDLGSVEVGKLADFTIINGDPLKDIKTTLNLHMLIKGGEIIDTSYPTSRWDNPIPHPYATAPVIRMMNPLMARQDGPAVTLELSGTGFRPGAIVRFDTKDLPTQFVSSTRLTATIGPELLSKTGEAVIYVLNPGQVNGNISPPKYFLVNFKN